MIGKIQEFKLKKNKSKLSKKRKNWKIDMKRSSIRSGDRRSSEQNNGMDEIKGNVDQLQESRLKGVTRKKG